MQTLEWFLDGFDFQPVLSEHNTTSLTLTPDQSTEELDGVRFTCRATAHSGHQFEETVTIRTSGILYYYILTYVRNEY